VQDDRPFFAQIAHGIRIPSGCDDLGSTAEESFCDSAAGVTTTEDDDTGYQI
jgi:hypothetical protein